MRISLNHILQLQTDYYIRLFFSLEYPFHGYWLSGFGFYFASLDSSDFTYHKKEADTDMSAYDRVLNAHKKIDTSYNPIMKKFTSQKLRENAK